MKKIIFTFLIATNITYANEAPPIDKLKAPQGFQIELYAHPVPGARSMTLGEKGTLFVGSRSQGKVYAITDNQKKIKVNTIAKNLNSPNGVAFKDGDLYVAEIHRVLKYRNIESHLANPPEPIIISTALPDKTHHGWRYIKFGPDNKLYIGIGAPCNVCLSADPKFATIVRMDRDGSNFEVYARGIRNTVGFDWHPTTKQLWFTDNGRDWMGDNLPPDEINKITRKNQHFGFPYCYGKEVADPHYGKDFPCTAFSPANFNLPAHVATLGMTFYTGNQFPKTYKNQIFIAEHGSWNRSTKIGYQVVTAALKNNNVIKTKPFITGWLNQKGDVWGRPVDILTLPDGSLLISDDYANAIYRVSYTSK